MTLAGAAKGSYRTREKGPVNVILTKCYRDASSVETPVVFGDFKPKQCRTGQIWSCVFSPSIWRVENKVK